MIEPLDEVAFAAFARRCEVLGKDTPTGLSDESMLQRAHGRWERAQLRAFPPPSAGMMSWLDHAGLPVYWFCFPQDLGALRVEKTHPLVQKAGELVEKSKLQNDEVGREFDERVCVVLCSDTEPGS